MARAVRTIEIVNNQRTLLGNHRRPGITQVTVATIVAENDLSGGCRVVAFLVQNARSDAKGCMPIAIDQQYAFVRQP